MRDAGVRAARTDHRSGFQPRRRHVAGGLGGAKHGEDARVAVDPPAPTQAPATWKPTHSFTGSGIKKTAIFTAPDDWKITWSCDPSSFYGSQYNVQVYVYSSDNTPTDVAINEICKNGNTSGDTEEHQGGDVYLEINSEGSWKVQVQELQ